MQIKDVEKLAELAKIELSEEEKKNILKDMESILDYVKQIESVDLPTQTGVDNIQYENRNIWREDLPEVGEPDFSRDLIMNQFPESQDGFLKVKKIL